MGAMRKRGANKSTKNLPCSWRHPDVEKQTVKCPLKEYSFAPWDIMSWRNQILRTPKNQKKEATPMSAMRKRGEKDSPNKFGMQLRHRDVEKCSKRNAIKKEYSFAPWDRMIWKTQTLERKYMSRPLRSMSNSNLRTLLQTCRVRSWLLFDFGPTKSRS